MKILVVTDNRFWRNELGSQRRISSLCDYFVERGHLIEVLFTGYLYPPDVEALKLKPLKYSLRTQGSREGLEESEWILSGLFRSLRPLWNVFRQLGIELGRRLRPLHQNAVQIVRNFLLQTREPKLQDFERAETLAGFREACERFVPEIVLVEYVRLAWVLKLGANVLPKGCLKLIDTHDVQSDRQSRFHRQGERHEIDISPAEEAQALKLGDVILAIQGTDAEKLRGLIPGKKVIVVGFPSPLHLHGPRAGGPVCIGFFGSSMLPNRNTAEKLIHQYFPPLRARFGAGVELHIYGGVCSDLAQPPADSGVQFKGFVDDLIAAYDAVDIIANPVDFGGGLKIKCVEALCHGRPLVTTEIGAEGLEHGVGLAFWLAADKQDFIAKLEQLVGDVGLRNKLGRQAMDFASGNLGSDVAFRELGDVLVKLSLRMIGISSQVDAVVEWGMNNKKAIEESLMNTQPRIDFSPALISPRYGAPFPMSIQLNELSEAERAIVLNKIESGQYRKNARVCRICDGLKFDVLAERDRYAFPIQSTICKDCGLVQTNPDFQQEDYIDFYQQHYRKLYIADLVGDPKEFFQEEVWRGQQILSFLKKSTNLPPNSLILEVGCGAGGILYALRERGFRVIGTDYGVDNLTYGRSMGLDIREGGLFSLDLVERPNLIIYSHVLEHVFNPNSELQKIREVLATDGHLYIEVPGVRAVRTNVFQGDFLQTLHLAHIYNFTLTTLTSLMHKNGFALVAGNEFIRSVFKLGPVVQSTTNDYQETIKYMQDTERHRHFYFYAFRIKVLVRAALQHIRVAGVYVLKKLGLYSWARRILT